ncbi:MAG: F0F1 ATP synthase subunit delta [bacterium]|nr:F0F1 ATP synthase subunit delta [bacterium]
MKKDKQIKLLVMKLVSESFNGKGEVVEEKVRKCLGVLKQLPLPKAIAALTEYWKGVKREMTKTTLEIESAVPLTAEQVQKVVSGMKIHFSITKVKNSVNPGLLGGMRVKISDLVYDDSVGKKVLQLKEAIHE